MFFKYQFPLKGVKIPEMAGSISGLKMYNMTLEHFVQQITKTFSKFARVMSKVLKSQTKQKSKTMSVTMDNNCNRLKHHKCV